VPLTEVAGGRRFWALPGWLASQFPLEPLSLDNVCPQVFLYLSKQIACVFGGLRSAQAVGFEPDDDVPPQSGMLLALDNLAFDQRQPVFQQVGIHG
jgi:hypothetical protein